MDNFTEKLNPVFKIDLYDESDSNTIALLEYIQPISALIEDSDYIKIWRDYGYFELSTRPSEEFKKNMVISIIPPEDVYAKYQEEFSDTDLSNCVPVLQSFGIDLFVWAKLDGRLGIYLTTNQPPRRENMFHFVASSIESLLFTNEGIENLSKDFRYIYFYSANEEGSE